MRVILGLFALVLFVCVAQARDVGQWEDTDPVIRQWYKSLMQPDIPTMPCCGLADAYWADSYEVAPDGSYIAIITDDRPDIPLGRPHRDVGTKILVPKGKLKFDQSNPTGHGIIFLAYSSDTVYCYLPPGGV